MYSKGSGQYNLRHASGFSVSNTKSTFHNTESLSYLALKIGDIVPKQVVELSSLSVFEKWKPQNCLCRLCIKYVKGLGFIWYFDVLDKILLSDFFFFDSRIEANWLAFVSPETEIIKEKRKKKIISDRMSAD